MSARNLAPPLNDAKEAKPRKCIAMLAGAKVEVEPIHARWGATARLTYGCTYMSTREFVRVFELVFTLLQVHRGEPW